MAPLASRAADRRPLNRLALAVACALCLAVPASCSGDGSGTSPTADSTGIATDTPASADSTGIMGVPPEGFTTVSIELAGGGAEPMSCCTYFADVPEERSRGLMGVTDLGGAAGMLFEYPVEQQTRFYMFNTPMPLSIAFFDGDGQFVSATDMKPCRSDDSADCPRYEAAAPFRSALEVPQGDLEDLGIGPGTTLEIVPGSERPTCAT